MTKLTVIVAAGGFARRMGIHKPKPMLSVRGKTLLEYILNSLQLAGVKNVIVFNNRNEFIKDQEKIIRMFKGVQLVRCHELKSTIELLHIAKNIIPSKKYLFCYGNAPRVKTIYKKIINCNKHLGAINLKESSRKDLIRNGNYFLEPPFLINGEKVSSLQNYKLWSELFFFFKKNIYHYHVDAPPEFNNLLEWNNYKQYICTYLEFPQ